MSMRQARHVDIRYRYTQNLMFITCSRFLSLIVPPTVCHGHVLSSVARERMTHLVCGSRKPKLELSKRAWVHEFAWLNSPATRCDYSGN